MTDLAHRSATELTGLLRSRRLGSRELLDEYLRRIDERNPALNAVVTLDVEGACSAARAADEMAARGAELGPLHGLPITVKDVLQTAGLRTTCGAEEFADFVPTTDAVVVQRLRAAGAIIFGKTNTPAYAGDAQTFNTLFGTTNNPWDLARSPGGSSGGSAAAVGAGLTGLCLGSDMGGSIRMPAGYCGVFGLRPSQGLVPLRGHLPPPPGTLSEPDLAVIGPLARDVDDLTLVLNAIAGPVAEDAPGWSFRLPPVRATARLGFQPDAAHCPVDAEVLTVLHAAVDALVAAGFPVDIGSPVDLGASADLCNRMLQAETAPYLTDDHYRELIGAAAGDPARPHTRWAAMVTASARDAGLARESRSRVRAQWAEYFRDHDVFLCPVTPNTAMLHDQNPDPDARWITVNGRQVPYWQQTRWVFPVTPPGLPVVVVPVGFTPAGLPVGMQVVGPRLEDGTVLAMAHRISEVVGGYRPPPDV